MSNDHMTKRPAGNRASGRAGSDLIYPNCSISPLICQLTTIQDLEREATRHRRRASHFATLADVAWRYGDQVNRRKMQRAQMAEIRIADAIRRVLLGAGEAGHE